MNVSESPLLQPGSVKSIERIVGDGIGDLDRVATDFAIFHITLAANGKIQNHGNLFAAVRASEIVLHSPHDIAARVYQQWSKRCALFAMVKLIIVARVTVAIIAVAPISARPLSHANGACHNASGALNTGVN